MLSLQRSPSASCAPASFSLSVHTPWQTRAPAQAPARDSLVSKPFSLPNPFAARPGPVPPAPGAAQAANPLPSLRPARVHNGDAQQGTLLVLAQMHRTTDPNNPYAKSPGIARSQGTILAALLQAKPSVVFFEGHHAPMDQGALDPAIVRAFQAAFGRWSGMQEGLNPKQAELLRRFGADVAYACLAKQPVRLPITEDPQVMEGLMQRVQAGAVLEEEAIKIHAPRDRHFAAVLKEHFKAHPGSTAIFVVGGAHDLIRQCDARQGFNPQLLWYNTTDVPTPVLMEQQALVYSEAH